MNKILISINVVLVAIVLYFLFSKSQDNTSTIPVEQQGFSQNATNTNYNIAYVNSYSLWANYICVQNMKDELAAEKLKIERQYSYEIKKLEEEVAEFQQKAQFMTMEQGQQREAELMQKQQELMQLQESLNQNFMESEQKKNKTVYDSITNYIDQYSKLNKLHFVFGYNLSGAMFYGVDSLNVTNEITDALNNRYKNSKIKS